MKSALIFMALCATGLCKPFASSDHEDFDISESLRRFIEMQNYEAQMITTGTEDEYTLDLIRIPRGRFSNETTEQVVRKPAVLLMPGMMSTYEDFVVGGPSEGLAFILADAGYDVYIGNARGSFYGQHHHYLNPKRDVAFWRYSWHEIGVKDIPTLIDTVRAASGEETVTFIGHMHATTAFYAMASARPEYNSKVNLMISLGPIAFMTHSKNDFIKELNTRIDEQEELLEKQDRSRKEVWHGAWIMNELGLNTYSWSEDILSQINLKCKVAGHAGDICANANFLVNGYNSDYFNMTTVNKIMERTPSPASSKEVLHYVQLMASGNFQRYNKHFDRTDLSHLNVYDLSKAKVPIAIFYTPDDSWSQEADVQTLISKLPEVVHTEKITSLSNNYDLLFANNVNETVYKSVLSVMQNYRRDFDVVNHATRRRLYDEEDYINGFGRGDDEERDVSREDFGRRNSVHRGSHNSEFSIEKRVDVYRGIPTETEFGNFGQRSRVAEFGIKKNVKVRGRKPTRTFYENVEDDDQGINIHVDVEAQTSSYRPLTMEDTYNKKFTGGMTEHIF